MSFLSTITSRFRIRPSSPTRAVIDGASLAANGRRGRDDNREQVLKRLADIGQREGINFSVVFGGPPFGDVDHGGEFRGVKVYFSSNREDFSDTFYDVLRRSGPAARAVVITSDKDVERTALAAGASVMRTSTFRRAFDEGQPRHSRNGSRGSRAPRNESRGRSRRRSSPRRNKNEEPDERESLLADIDLV